MGIEWYVADHSTASKEFRQLNQKYAEEAESIVTRICLIQAERKSLYKPLLIAGPSAMKVVELFPTLFNRSELTDLNTSKIEWSSDDEKKNNY